MTQRYDMYINGQFVAPSSGQYFDSVSPADGTLVARVGQGNAEDIDRAVQAAFAAKRAWAEMNPLERGRILLGICREAGMGRDEPPGERQNSSRHLPRSGHGPR